MLDFSQNRLNTDQIDWKYGSVYFKVFTSLAAITEVKEYALSFLWFRLKFSMSFYLFKFLFQYFNFLDTSTLGEI